jgi:hypothetical protein
VEWYGGGLPNDATRTRTDRILGGCGEALFGLRIRRGEGIIGDSKGSAGDLTDGCGGLSDVMVATGLLLRTFLHLG